MPYRPDIPQRKLRLPAFMRERGEYAFLALALAVLAYALLR